MRRVGGALAIGVALVAAGGALAAGPPPQNYPAGPHDSRSRFDPSVAASSLQPGVLALGDTVVTDSYAAEISVSRDSGRTWQRASALPLPRGANAAGETTVGFAGRRLVVTYLAFHAVDWYVQPPYAGGLLLVTSTDLGKHWSAPRTLQGYTDGCGRFPVMPAISADHRTVAVVWENEEGSHKCVRPFSSEIAVSHDGGATWTLSMLRFHSAQPYGWPAVAVSGARVVVTARLSCAVDIRPMPTPAGCRPWPNQQQDRLVAFTSDDGGRTFAGPVTVAPDFGIDRSNVVIDQATHEIVATDARFSPNPAAFAGLLTNDQVWVSKDGTHWQRRSDPLPQLVGATAASLAVVPQTGALVYLALAQGEERAGSLPILVTSTDGGASWSCPQLLTRHPTPWATAYSTRSGLAITGFGAHPVWPDPPLLLGAEELTTATVNVPLDEPTAACAPVNGRAGSAAALSQRPPVVGAPWPS